LKKCSLLGHTEELPPEVLLQFKCYRNRCKHEESIEGAIILLESVLSRVGAEADVLFPKLQ